MVHVTCPDPRIGKYYKLYGKIINSLLTLATTIFYIVMQVKAASYLFISFDDSLLCVLGLVFPVERDNMDSSIATCNVFIYTAHAGMLLLLIGYFMHVYMWFRGGPKFIKLVANLLIATALGLSIFSAVQISHRLNELCGSLDALSFYCQTVSIPTYNGFVNVIDSINFYRNNLILNIVQCSNMGLLILFSIFDIRGFARIGIPLTKKIPEPSAKAISTGFDLRAYS